jgi:hypothetical protein
MNFIAEVVGFGLIDEIATLDAPSRDGVGDSVDDLLERLFTLDGAWSATEVLLRHDVGGVQRPGDGELDSELFEGD